MSTERGAKKQRRDDDDEQPEDGAEQQHENDSNEDEASASAAADPAATSVRRRLARLEHLLLHFSKIAKQFELKPDTASFMNWTVGSKQNSAATNSATCSQTTQKQQRSGGQTAQRNSK